METTPPILVNAQHRHPKWWSAAKEAVLPVSFLTSKNALAVWSIVCLKLFMEFPLPPRTGVRGQNFSNDLPCARARITTPVGGKNMKYLERNQISKYLSKRLKVNYCAHRRRRGDTALRTFSTDKENSAWNCWIFHLKFNLKWMRFFCWQNIIFWIMTRYFSLIKMKQIELKNWNRVSSQNKSAYVC